MNKKVSLDWWYGLEKSFLAEKITKGAVSHETY